MSIREEMEAMEQETLSPHATLSVNSRGRDREEDWWFKIPSRTSQVRFSPFPSFSSCSTMRTLCSLCRNPTDETSFNTNSRTGIVFCTARHFVD